MNVQAAAHKQTHGGAMIKPIYSDLFKPHTYTVHFIGKESLKVSFGPRHGRHMMHVPSFR